MVALVPLRAQPSFLRASDWSVKTKVNQVGLQVLQGLLMETDPTLITVSSQRMEIT